MFTICTRDRTLRYLLPNGRRQKRLYGVGGVTDDTGGFPSQPGADAVLYGVLCQSRLVSVQLIIIPLKLVFLIYLEHFKIQ